FNTPSQCSIQERCPAIAVPCVNIRSGLDQSRRYLHQVVLGGYMQRRAISESTDYLHIGPGSQQELDQFQTVLVLTGKAEDRIARSMDVSARFEQSTDGFQAAPTARRHEWRPACRPLCLQRRTRLEQYVNHFQIVVSRSM